MEIYLFKDELDAIASFLEENSSVKRIKSDMAEAAGCQLSYLSQAMSGRVLLTPDQLHGIAKFMRLNEVEADYLMLLLQIKRAGSIDLKTHLKKKLTLMRAAEFRIDKKIKAKDKVSEKDLQRYYGDWRYQAIHMLLTIPRYQRLSSIAEKLFLSELQVRALVEDLANMGLARKQGEFWIAEMKNMHLPANSPHLVANQLQWKMRSMLNMQDSDAGVHYLATFSLSNSDIENLKGLVLEFVSNSRKLAEASPEEEVAHLNLSFFRV